MEMLTDFFAVLHDFDQLIRQIFWMGCHEADTAKPFYLFDFLQKTGERHRFFQIFAVRIYILAQKHNLHHTVSYKLFNLSYNIFWTSASLPAAHIGYNAVAAEIIASEHNIDTGFEGILPLRRQILHNLIGIFPNVNDHTVRSEGTYDQL